MAEKPEQDVVEALRFHLRTTRATKGVYVSPALLERAIAALSASKPQAIHFQSFGQTIGVDGEIYSFGPDGQPCEPVAWHPLPNPPTSGEGE